MRTDSSRTVQQYPHHSLGGGGGGELGQGEMEENLGHGVGAGGGGRDDEEEELEEAGGKEGGGRNGYPKGGLGHETDEKQGELEGAGGGGGRGEGGTEDAGLEANMESFLLPLQLRPPLHSPVSSPPLRPPNVKGLAGRKFSGHIEPGGRPRGLPVGLDVEVAAADHPESLVQKMAEACRRAGVVLVRKGMTAGFVVGVGVSCVLSLCV